MPTKSAPIETTDINAPITEAQLKAIQKAQTHWSYRAGLIIGISGTGVNIAEIVHRVVSGNLQAGNDKLVIGGIMTVLIGNAFILYSADKNKPLSRRYED